MARILIGLIFMIALALFMRHQYQLVIRRATAPQPSPQSLVRRPADGPHKCPICGGTGRNPFHTFRPNGQQPPGRTDPCPTCHGTGWIDGPAYGR